MYAAAFGGDALGLFDIDRFSPWRWGQPLPIGIGLLTLSNILTGYLTGPAEKLSARAHMVDRI